jgi:hypothetical protein
VQVEKSTARYRRRRYFVINKIKINVHRAAGVCKPLRRIRLEFEYSFSHGISYIVNPLYKMDSGTERVNVGENSEMACAALPRARESAEMTSRHEAGFKLRPPACTSVCGAHACTRVCMRGHCGLRYAPHNPAEYAA